jgi:hypothetical protein
MSNIAILVTSEIFLNRNSGLRTSIKKILVCCFLDRLTKKINFIKFKFFVLTFMSFCNL